MSVNPGKSGQRFIESQYKKIQQLKKLLLPTTEICVDGGVSAETAGKCIESGADCLVTGSFLFNNGNYADSINALLK
jgi:ribulose-phosphate 3-epimerase